MARETTPLVVADLSSFARQLARTLAEQATPPSHVQFLNLIARAAGYRNLQALQARAATGVPSVVQTPPPLSENARRALMQFDAAGRLVRWPAKFSVQSLILWPLWTHFEARRLYTEAEVNTILKAANAFGDHVTLRRELINHRLLTRKSDCSEYRKLPARPDDEARALMAAWRQRLRARDAGRAAERQAARAAFEQRAAAGVTS